MKNNATVRLAVLGIAVVTIFVGSSSRVLSQELINQKALPVDMALAIAQGALEQCRVNGSHVSVTVLDGSGLPKVFIRDDQSGPHTIDLSQRKAYTAFTYQRTSGEQAKYWASLPPPPFTVQGTVALPGGVPIKVGSDVIGAIGVSGSAEPPPGKDLGVVTGNADEKCAMAGVAKVAGKLKWSIAWSEMLAHERGPHSVYQELATGASAGGGTEPFLEDHISGIANTTVAHYSHAQADEAAEKQSTFERKSPYAIPRNRISARGGCARRCHTGSTLRFDVCTGIG